MKYPIFKREEKKSCKLTDEDIAEINYLRKSGETLKYIGDRYGITKPAVSYWLKSDEERKEINRIRHLHDTVIERNRANISSKLARNRKDKQKLKEWRSFEYKRFIKNNPNYHKEYLRKWRLKQNP